MKHCKNCENCNKDLICDYLKGYESYRCGIDGHHIEDAFWDKCENYSRDFFKAKNESNVYNLFMRMTNAKKQHG